MQRLAVAVVLLMLLSALPASASQSSTAPKRIIGYYTSWSIYGRNYQVHAIPAAKLTHVNYAFANIFKGKCAVGDSEADLKKFYDGDTRQTLRGNFNQFKKLKEQYPHLKLVPRNRARGSRSRASICSSRGSIPASTRR